jgi:hypothetical protein
MARAGSRQPSLLCRSYGASGEEIASIAADVNRPMEAHAEVAAAPAKRPEPIRDGPRHGHDVDRRCRDEPVERARRRHCARARANDADPDFSRSCADGIACGDGAPTRGMDRPSSRLSARGRRMLVDASAPPLARLLQRDRLRLPFAGDGTGAHGGGVSCASYLA